MKRFWLALALALLPASAFAQAPPLLLLDSPSVVNLGTVQTLPLNVNVGWAPDASGQAMGYTVQLDSGAAVDVGMPATNPSCKAFVGGAVTTCLEATVSVTTAGSHTVSIVAYSIGGNSTAGTVTFPVGPAPGTPSGLKVVR